MRSCSAQSLLSCGGAGDDPLLGEGGASPAAAGVPGRGCCCGLSGRPQTADGGRGGGTGRQRRGSEEGVNKGAMRFSPPQDRPLLRLLAAALRTWPAGERGSPPRAYLPPAYRLPIPFIK